MNIPDLSKTLSKDHHFLKTAFRQPEKFGGLEKVQQKYQKSHDLFLQRQARVPAITLNQDLPVYEKREDIKTAIQNNQVTIICGETG
ncbi:ATP-dependent RNA helicase HrpA, partial [Kingella kingae]|nr:ATP-dependent RNA helicase HrpA [Kingella kingae]